MSLAQHLPALQVVLPLMAAPLVVLLRRSALGFALVTLVSWVSLGIAIALWRQVDAGGTISYAIGNWPPPLGIEYRVDRLTSFILVLVAGVAALVVPYSRRSVETEIPREQHYLFYSLFALALAGLLGITITGDAFNIFVFLEISSLSTYALIALGRDRRALLAAYRYLIMGSIGATFIVIGIGLLYLMTGTLNLADLGARLPAVRDSRPLLAAMAFLTVGIGLKLALFPLHQWLPNAYTFAPSAVAAFLAGTATKVAIYVLLRFYFSVFDQSAFFQRMPWSEILLVLSLAAMFVASATAIFQDDLRRLLAYSSIGQIGYITLGIALASESGLTAAIAHMFNHGITKAALFMLCGCAVVAVGGTSMSQLAGLGRRMPLTAFCMVVGGLSLIGVPGTAGFVSKWYLLLAAFETGNWWLVLAILASSLLAVVYVWRFVEVAYLKAPPGDHGLPREAPLSMLVPACLASAAVIWFGLDAGFVTSSASAAAVELLGAAK